MDNEFNENLKYIREARKQNLSDTQIRDKLSIEYSNEYIDKLFGTEIRNKVALYAVGFFMIFLFLSAFFLGAPRSMGYAVLGVENYVEEQPTFYGLIFILSCAVFAISAIIIGIAKKISRD